MSWLVLAIDTASEYGSAALARDGQLMEEVPMHGPNGFDDLLFPQIEALLLRHGLTVDSIDCFASACGPGSFTGVRVGLAVMKGLAMATSKPMCAVSNLKAVALQGTASRRAVLFDARRGDIFGALYNANLTQLLDEVVMPLQQWLKQLPEGEVEFLSTNIAPFEEALKGRTHRSVSRNLAGAVAMLATPNQAVNPREIDASYVRRCDAEMFWQDK